MKEKLNETKLSSPGTRLLPALLLLLTAAFLVLALPDFHQKAEASTGYAEIPESGSVKKIGSRYFKCYRGVVYYGSSKSSVNKKAPDVSWNAFTNGSQIYYTKDSKGHYYVKVYSIATGKSSRVAAMPYVARAYDTYDYFTITAIYKDRIYLTRTNEEKWVQDTYFLDLRAPGDSITKVAGSTDIEQRYGKYVLARHAYVTDVSPYKVTLNSIRSDGKLKKIKTLGNYTYGARISGNYVYYAVYTSIYMSDCSIYKMKLDGTGKTKIRNIRSTSGSEKAVIVYDINAKSCKVYIDGNMFKVDMKTKKITKI